MKVAMINRSSSLLTPGGDTVQVHFTAKYLRKSGVVVDIFQADDKIDYNQYDLLHFFNIIRPGNILSHIKNTTTPFVVSPIYVEYVEYERNYRGGLAGKLARMVSSDNFEYIKGLARTIKSGEKPFSRDYFFNGHRKSIQQIIKKAALLLPNSQSEYKRLENNYGFPAKYVVVPSGCDYEIFQEISPAETNQRKGIISVGRIEGRKNHLNLIRAINDSEYELTIVGNPAPNQLDYYAKCKTEAGLNVKFIQHIPQEALPDLYKNAKVHVLASWFETTGLSTLEAAAMGCNIVITEKGDTRDYFGDYAYYCDPADPDSIKKAIDKAYNAPINYDLMNFVRQNYTWQKAAEITLEGYKIALGL